MHKMYAAIFVAFGLYWVYLIGWTHGERQSENKYATEQCIGETIRSSERWQKAIDIALSPASGVELTTQERQEVSNVLLSLQNRSKLPVVEKECKETIGHSGPQPRYEISYPGYLQDSTFLKLRISPPRVNPYVPPYNPWLFASP